MKYDTKFVLLAIIAILVILLSVTYSLADPVITKIPQPAQNLNQAQQPSQGLQPPQPQNSNPPPQGYNQYPGYYGPRRGPMDPNYQPSYEWYNNRGYNGGYVDGCPWW